MAAAPLLADKAAPTMETFRDELTTGEIKQVELKSATSWHVRQGQQEVRL
jgi:hypothetical protein